MGYGRSSTMHLLTGVIQVSRSWQQRLSSNEVCNAALHHHFSGEAGTLDSDSLGPAQCLFSKARQHQALTTGRPYSKASFACNMSFGPFGNHAFQYFNAYCDYHSGKLVWVDSSSSTAVALVRNLASGRVFSISPRNRESIHQVKISDSLVAVVSNLG